MHYDYVKTTFELDWVAQACHKRLRQGDSKIKFCLLQNETCPKRLRDREGKAKIERVIERNGGGSEGVR